MINGTWTIGHHKIASLNTKLTQSHAHAWKTISAQVHHYHHHHLNLTWLASKVKLRRARPHRKHSIPYLSESSNNYSMVVRRVQLQKTSQELPKVFFGVYFILQYHLEHWLSKIQIWVIWFFLNCNTLTIYFAKPSDCPWALYIITLSVVNAWRHCVCVCVCVCVGVGFVPWAWRRRGVVFVFLVCGGFGFWLWIEYVT